MRVKMRSTTPMRALAAGTKLPTCASSTISATCRRYVDLPAMFGPVSTTIWRSAAVERRVVGHEAALAQRALDHRVAPVLDHDDVAVVDLGAHVAVARRRLRQAGVHVDLATMRAAPSASAQRRQLRADLPEQRRLQLADRLARAQDAFFQLLQPRRHEALAR